MSDSFDRVEALHEYLEPEAVQAYKAIARRNPIDDVSDRILAKLLDVGLVRPTPELPWLYSAMDPKIALERWRRDLYQRARNMMDASEEVERLLPRLNDAFHASAPSVIPGGIEYVADRDMVNARIEALFQNCTSELRTAQP